MELETLESKCCEWKGSKILLHYLDVNKEWTFTIHVPYINLPICSNCLYPTQFACINLYQNPDRMLCACAIILAVLSLLFYPIYHNNKNNPPIDPIKSRQIIKATRTRRRRTTSHNSNPAQSQTKESALSSESITPLQAMMRITCGNSSPKRENWSIWIKGIGMHWQRWHGWVYGGVLNVLFKHHQHRQGKHIHGSP